MYILRTGCPKEFLLEMYGGFFPDANSRHHAEENLVLRTRNREVLLRG